MHNLAQLAPAAGFYDGEIPYLKILATAGIKVIDFSDFLKPNTNDIRLHKFLANHVDRNKVALFNSGDADLCGNILSDCF